MRYKQDKYSISVGDFTADYDSTTVKSKKSPEDFRKVIHSIFLVSAAVCLVLNVILNFIFNFSGDLSVYENVFRITYCTAVVFYSFGWVEKVTNPKLIITANIGESILILVSIVFTFIGAWRLITFIF